MTGTSGELVPRVSRTLDALAPAGARCLLAVSGGPDSLALLDLLADPAATHGRPLVVGHVDHGIGAASAEVAATVAAAAAARGIEFLARSLALGPACSETRARAARRDALREMADASDAEVIVLAHHADDQVETVLLRLLRGSGPAGLAGMAARRGRWLRPLLAIPREELAAHLASRGLVGWDDPANRDPRHLRSWLRQEILPAVARRLPDVADRVATAARQAAAVRLALDALPALVPALEHQRSAHGISVAAPTLLGYRSEVRHAVLAAIGRRFGVPLGARRISAIERLLKGQSGVVQLTADLEAELAYGRLTFQRNGGAGMSTDLVLEPGATGQVGDVRVTVTAAAASEVARAGWGTTLALGRYVARTWRPGDRIRPLHGRGARAVSVLLREARIPPRHRAAWPVIVRTEDATIVWVPGICRSESCLPEHGTEALHVECAVT